MASLLTTIEIKRLELAALESVEKMQQAQATLNKARVSSGLPPAPREFLSVQEHESAIAGLTPKAEPAPKSGRRFELSGGDPTTEMRRKGYDLDAEHAWLEQDEFSLREIEAAWTQRQAPFRSPKRPGSYAEGFHDAWMVALWSFHPRFVEHDRRQAAYSRAFAESPAGRADQAWCDMMERAAKLVAGGSLDTLSKMDHGAIVRALAGDDPSKIAVRVGVGEVKATPEMILRANAMRRGEIVELPTDSTARAIIAAGAKRRGVGLSNPPPIGSAGAQVIAVGRRARGEDDDRLSSPQRHERKPT